MANNNDQRNLNKWVALFRGLRHGHAEENGDNLCPLDNIVRQSNKMKMVLREKCRLKIIKKLVLTIISTQMKTIIPRIGWAFCGNSGNCNIKAIFFWVVLEIRLSDRLVHKTSSVCFIIL